MIVKFFIIILFFFLGKYSVGLEPIAGFDHEAHLSKVFKPQKMDCSHCHNFSVDEKNQKIELTELAKKSVLKIPLKQICHECHQSEELKYKSAPKTCISCHKTMEGLSKIKPASHENMSWKGHHSLEARVGGESCLNCHMASQCSKCHLQRNDAELRNHPKNFKLFHSIQARGQPQRCDACHTKTFCTNCHLGKR